MPWKQMQKSAFARRLDDFKRGPFTVIVWCAAIGVVGFLFQHRLHRSEYIGLARGREYRISSEMGGRIESLLVDLCDEVKAGDIVAKLDDSLLAAQIETARGAVKQLQAELETKRIETSADNAKRQSDWEARLADFESREERYRVDALNLKVTIEGDRVEAERLGLETGRKRKLMATNAVSQEDYDSIRLQHEQVMKRISENTLLAARIDKNCEEAKARREEFVKRRPELQAEDQMIAPLREAIRKEELELEELRIQREGVILRAPVDGRVTQILCQAGQAVTPGESILVIGEGRATQVVGFLSDGDTTALREKQVVHISRVTEPERTAAVAIVRVGAGVEELPSRLWRDPSRPEYGRCFVVSASEPLNLAPGEKVRIRMPRRGM